MFGASERGRRVKRLAVDRMTSAEQISRSLPAGYEFEHDERAWLATRSDAAASLADVRYGLNSSGTPSTSVLAGRKPLLEMPTESGVLLVRRFSHGGLLRAFTGSRFADPARPFRELCSSAELASLGVSTPEVVAARARRSRGFGWNLEIVTRRVDGAIDLGKLVELARRGEIDAAEVREIIAALGRFVARLHAIGFVHADLTLNNILVERASAARGPPRLWLIDLEGARFAGPLGDAERRDNLRRLLRFVLRREAREGRLLRRTDFARFMHSYDASRAKWKDDWTAIRRAHERRRVWHALGWMLEALRREPVSTRDVRARTAGAREPDTR
jgi:tRNA A-37 threonylcarbamoyl transferase component Bud32